eukprot:39309-Amphidinium_carterae.4
MAEYVMPYPITDPACEGLVRLYPAARPRPPIGLQKPYRWMEEMNGYTRESTYESEKGCYPFSVVRRLPDVIPGHEESVMERVRMERKALYEILRTDNPDEYPWPGAPEELDPYCQNRNPKNGPMNWDVWYNDCMRQTERRSFEPPREGEERRNYFCYVCKKS